MPLQINNVFTTNFSLIFSVIKHKEVPTKINYFQHRHICQVKYLLQNKCYSLWWTQNKTKYTTVWQSINVNELSFKINIVCTPINKLTIKTTSNININNTFNTNNQEYKEELWPYLLYCRLVISKHFYNLIFLQY